MKVVGIPVAVQFPRSGLLKNWLSCLSEKLNRLRDRNKKLVVLLFVLVSVAVVSGLLIRGASGEYSAGLAKPNWEPPLIYYDSLFHKTQTKQLYEKAD